MMIATLNDIKLQLRIESNEEDALLTQYGEAAEEMVLSYTERSIEEFYELFGRLPVRLKLCVLMLVNHWYENRTPLSSISLSSVPYTIDALLKPLMSL